MPDTLKGFRILILETREEAKFARLLADQGAEVLQCPMFMINDAPDPAPVEAWIRRSIENPFDDLILMTGEGLRRLMKVVERMNSKTEFIASLGKSRKFTRGPKPGLALREIGLEPQIPAETPTSDGMVAMLSRFNLSGRRVGLQLYPDKDHESLIGSMAAQGADIDTVLPYVYDAKAAKANIITAIDEMAEGRVNSIAVTSSGQVRRLIAVAREHGCEARLRVGLNQTAIACIGPVVADELRSYGLRADIVPDSEAYFMRPLIAAMARALGNSGPLPADEMR